MPSATSDLVISKIPLPKPVNNGGRASAGSISPSKHQFVVSPSNPTLSQSPTAVQRRGRSEMKAPPTIDQGCYTPTSRVSPISSTGRLPTIG